MSYCASIGLLAHYVFVVRGGNAGKAGKVTRNLCFLGFGLIPSVMMAKYGMIKQI